MFAGNVFLCIVLSISVGFAFSSLEAVQILVLQILFRLDIPANMYKILGPILMLSNFDVYPTDFLYAFLFGFTETESFDQIFEEAGF